MNKAISVAAVAIAVGLVFAMSMAVKLRASAPPDPHSVFNLSAATGNIDPVGEPVPPNPTLLKHGEWIYRGSCIGCHGVDGDGNGAVWELGDEYAPEHKLPRKPRDFTEAVFKLRSTPSGSFPTDVDLFKSISRGLVADQDMPAFKFLPERDRWAVVAYIKTLSERWEEEAEYQEDAIVVSEPPAPDAQMLVAGKEVYKLMKCAKCHGPLGLGDGPSAPELEDDAGLPIKPRNFGDATQFVGDSSPKGVYQTFMTGLDGTPMPAFSDFLDEKQGWELVWYVISLRTDFDLHATRVAMLGEEAALASVVPAPAAIPAVAAAAPADATSAEANAEQQPTEVATAPAAEAEAAPAAAAEGDAADGATTSTYTGKYTEREVSDGGSIVGKILYNGSVKKKTVLPSKDKNVCGKIRKVPLIFVGDGGVVKDAVVFLKGVESGKAWTETMVRQPVLDQVNCQFEPHVQVARQGSIDIINSDPVLHNTHGYYGTRTAFNVALPQQDQKVTKAIKRPGTVRVDCDAHGWMLGWVQVVDNPYFAQTSDDGSFVIDEVPPGEYTLVVWQEWLGEKEFPVTVTAGGTLEFDVELTQ